MTNHNSSRLLKIFSTGLLLAAVFSGLFISSAQNYVITVNSIEDTALAKDAKECDIDLIDFEPTCTLRAAIEFAKQKYKSEPDIYDFFIINFDDSIKASDKQIQILSNLPSIDIPVVIDGLGDECSNPKQKRAPLITLQGNGSYVKGLRFESFVTQTSTSAHGSKVCGLALDGFGQGPLSINGYWDSNLAKFRDADLKSQYQITNNYFGFDTTGLSFVNDGSNGGKVTVSATQNVLLQNNIVRNYVSLYNTNSISITDSLLTVNKNGMPVDKYNSSSIAISHNSVDDKVSNDILVENNLMAAVYSSSLIDGLKINNNTICFSPYMQNGVQKYMNLCKSRSPISFANASNIQITNNQVAFGEYDSGYEFEPDPTYLNNFFYASGTIDNMLFDSNNFGLKESTPDSYYFSGVVINKLTNSTITNSSFFGGNNAFNVYYDFANNVFENLTFLNPLTNTNRNYGILQNYSSGSFTNNIFRNITFENFKRSMLKASSSAQNNIFDNVKGDIPYQSYIDFSKLAFESSSGDFAKPPQPQMFGYNLDESKTKIDFKITYPTSAEKCDFQMFLANNDTEYFAKNTTRLTFSENNQTSTMVNAVDGNCIYQGSVIVPSNYIWSQNNVLFYQSTDYIGESFQTTSFSDYRLFKVEVSADIAFTDYDTNDDFDFSFPLNQDIKFSLANAQNVQQVIYDLDTNFDSNNDGVLDNDQDFIGDTLILNLKNQTINDLPKTFSDLNSYPHNIKVDIHGLGQIITKEFILEPFETNFADQLESCIVADSQTGLATLNGPIIKSTIFEPRHLQLDFDTNSDSNNDGIMDNDLDSTDPFVTSVSYESFGEKQLMLTAFDSSQFTQSQSVTHTVSVYPALDMPTAEIKATIDSQTVQFSLQGVNTCLDSVEWSFGDGTTETGFLNTQKTYAEAGEYTVLAKLINQDYTNIVSLNLVVGIQQPTAQFTTQIDSQTAIFTNTSSNLTNAIFEWDFDNDGIIDSTEKNPIYEYATPGTFQVTLTVSNPTGSDTFTQEVVIEEPQKLLISNDLSIQELSLESQNTSTDKLQTTFIKLSDNANALWELNNSLKTIQIEAPELKLSFIDNIVNDQEFELDPIEKLFLNITTLDGQTHEYIINLLDSRFNQETACLAANTDNLFAASSLTQGNYQWLLDDIETSTDSRINLSNITLGQHTLKLIVAKGDQSSTSSMQIDILPEPELPVGEIQILDELHTDSKVIVSLNAEFSGDCLTYKWDFESDGTIDAYTKNTTAAYTTNIDYSLSLKVANKSQEVTLVKPLKFFDQTADLTTQNPPVSDTPETENLSVPSEPTPETQPISETPETPIEESIIPTEPNPTTEEPEETVQTQEPTPTAEEPEETPQTQESEETPEAQESTPLTQEPEETTQTEEPSDNSQDSQESEADNQEQNPEPTQDNQQPQDTTEPQADTQEAVVPQPQPTPAVASSNRRRRSRSTVSHYTPPIKKVYTEVAPQTEPPVTKQVEVPKTVATVVPSIITDTSSIQIPQSPVANVKKVVTTQAVVKTENQTQKVSEVEVIKDTKVDFKPIVQANIIDEPKSISTQKTLVLKSEDKKSNLFENFLTASLQLEKELSYKQVKNLESYQKNNLLPDLIPTAQIREFTDLQKQSTDYQIIDSFDYQSKEVDSTNIQETRNLLDNNVANNLGLETLEINNSYLKERSLYKAPSQVNNSVLLELSSNQSFPGSKFVINGQIQSSFPAVNNQIEIFVKDYSNQKWQSLGLTNIDKNNNFSFFNTQKLRNGKYLLVAQAKTLDSKTINSAVFSIEITEFAKLNAPKISLNQETNTLSLDNLDADTILTFNLQSVLYSSQAIISSTNSNLAINLPQIDGFEPGSNHRLTVYAESSSNPELRSAVETIEFSIPDLRQNNAYLYTLAILILAIITYKVSIDKKVKRLQS